MRKMVPSSEYVTPVMPNIKSYQLLAKQYQTVSMPEDFVPLKLIGLTLYAIVGQYTETYVDVGVSIVPTTSCDYTIDANDYFDSIECEDGVRHVFIKGEV